MRLAEAERVQARVRLTESEKGLSLVIFERLGEGDSFARIRSRGDQALGGTLTREMKAPRRAASAVVADFLPTVTIKAKDLANEITIHNTKEHDLRSEPAISDEHVANNTEVRNVLSKRGIARAASRGRRRQEGRASAEVGGQEAAARNASLGRARGRSAGDRFVTDDTPGQFRSCMKCPSKRQRRREPYDDENVN